jgi:hypothetical protein
MTLELLRPTYGPPEFLTEDTRPLALQSGTEKAPSSSRPTANEGGHLHGVGTNATYSSVLRFCCSLCGKSDHNSYAFHFSGRDYCMMLYAVFPSAISLDSVCWSNHPIPAQLQENLDYFIRSAKAQSERLLQPFPAEVQSAIDLQPTPSCSELHLKVLGWIHLMARHFSIPTSYSAMEILRARIVEPNLSYHGVSFGKEELPPTRVFSGPSASTASSSINSSSSAEITLHQLKQIHTLRQTVNGFRRQLLEMAQKGEVNWSTLSKALEIGESPSNGPSQ